MQPNAAPLTGISRQSHGARSANRRDASEGEEDARRGREQSSIPAHENTGHFPSQKRAAAGAHPRDGVSADEGQVRGGRGEDDQATRG